MVGRHNNFFKIITHKILVSAVSWLENKIFLVAHTPSSFESGTAPVTTYHLITLGAQGATFQKFPELCPPFGPNHSSPFQFMQRLKDFPPNLSDALVVASTASTDVGLVTRSKTPLTNNLSADRITNVFTTTNMLDDSRRAQLPLTEGLGDTSPIGVALDLSSKDKVKRPLPQEEYDESQTPLPALMILNNEGILASWWIVYAESIRQGTTYPGLAIAGGAQTQQPPSASRQASPFGAPTPQAAPAFSQSTFGKPSTPAAAFGSTAPKPATAAFGSKSTFGSGGGAFGAPSGLGKPQSPWGAPSNTASNAQSGTPAFGQPAFGSSTPLGAGASQGTAFGQAGGLGNRASPWGTPSTGTAAASGRVFGQAGGLDKPNPFGAPSSGATFGSTTATLAPSSGGFASFATKPSGFLSAAPSADVAQSLFGKGPPGGSFGSGMDTDTSFGQTPKKAEAPKGAFGGGSGFKLGSTFKSDGSAANDAPKPPENTGGSMFGSSFGDMLHDTQANAFAAPQSKDADMGDEDDDAPVDNVQRETAREEAKEEAKEDVKTPTAAPAPPKALFPQTEPPKTGGLFGTQSQSKITPAAVQNSAPSGSMFGKPTPITTTPKDSPEKPEDKPRPSVETSPKIKIEPQSDDDSISPLNEEESAPPEGYDVSEESRPRTPETPPSKAPDAPVPPESTSKSSYAPGDSSSSSKSSDDAPLPPDFLPAKTKLKEVESPPEEQTKLPGDDEDAGLDDEGSGVDVAQEISPTTDTDKSPKITPGSSFGAAADKSPNNLLVKVSHSQQKQEAPKGRVLFGEVSNTSVPFFPPPAKVQESPRSPSPVRANRMANSLRPGSLRPDNSRSISAPGPFQALNNRKAQLNKLTVPSKPQPSVEELRKQEQEHLAAERSHKPAEEQQDLSDHEDERFRGDMDRPIEATKVLEPFVAHTDYIGNVSKPGIPGQIEKVYRDINSMIDTVGINARSLRSFVAGHSELINPEGRTKDDLESPDWALTEIAELPSIEDDLLTQLHEGRLDSIQANLSACRDLRKDLSTLHHRTHDLTRAISARNDPLATQSALTAPLSLEQSTQQRDLRRQFTKFQKLLAESEEGIVLLRAKLSSCAPKGSAEGATGMKQPTVEAVTNTIRKMTSMIEKKSADIDALETRMRGFRFSSPANGDATPSSSAFGTPDAKGRAGKGKGLQNGTPTPGHAESPLRRALNEDGTLRRGGGGLSEEEIEGIKARERRRRDINAVVRDVLGRGPVRVRTLE